MHQQHQIDYRRVERGIAYIAAHFREGPALEDVAAAAHVSPFHFQRMFTAWAGVSPKTFARYLSLDHARHALRDGGASLLGAALDSGLSGPGRLHDLFVSVEGNPGRLCARRRRAHHPLWPCRQPVRPALHRFDPARHLPYGL